ncbi:class I histocompatibility antigen, F10 alpha chain-like [Chanodichthys erythropterus]|uniref:class I histocompatibility antigen, F10 alpha chain-like n=1 Tax=Chanodichthys erythropterus TaxID=933992 RepID=UPI00351E488A
MQSVALLLIGIQLVYAGKHSLQYFYTATSGLPNLPQFVSVGIVDGQPFTYYDSKIRRMTPRQDWMAKSVGEDYWERNTQASIGSEQAFINNINVVKDRFNQTGGVHTYQEMYGCEWDDETEEINGFDEDGFDGGDFTTLDYKEKRYISPVPQGLATAEKWNRDGSLQQRKNYLGTICVEWLKKYLEYGKSSLQKKVSPQVSVLQKDPSSPVTCHATGFYPSGVTITWMKNGREHHEDVEVGELLPNEDGTFQKTSSITVTPDEWKKNEYSCVVEHQGKSVTEDEIRSNKGDSVPIGIIVGALGAVVLLIIIVVAGYKVYQKKKGFKPVNGSDDGSNSSAHTVPQA